MRIAVASLAIVLAACAISASSSMAGRKSELANRVAGAPQRCVPTERGFGLRVDESDRHVLLYGYGRNIWANNLGPDCSFHPSDTLVVERLGSDYCRGDFVRSVDPTSPIQTKSCRLNDFVPYTKG